MCDTTRAPRICRAIGAVLFCLAFPALAQSQTKPQSQPSPAAYRISGKVVDAHTGVALARCSVQISNVRGGFSDVQGGAANRTVTTGDDGAFSFDRVPLGKYSLTAARRGYLTQSFDEHDQFSTAIAVGPDLVSEGFVFRLMPQAILSGTITDEAGEPVRNASVRLFEDRDTDGIRKTELRENVMTDDRGQYEIDSLRPGAYFLVVTAHPWYAQHAPSEASEASQSDLDVAYPPTFYPGVTDQDAATPIPVKGGERLEASLILSPERALRLRVPISPGDSRRGTSISLNQSLFGTAENQPVEMQMLPDGAMELEGILPGHYDVTLAKYPAGGLGRPESIHFDADVASGSTELAADVASGEVSITGKVVSPDAKLPAGGGIILRALHSRQQQYAPLNDRGEFSVDVQPGSYEILGNLPQMYLSRIVADGAPLSGRTLNVKPGTSPKLEIAAGSGFAQIDGVAQLNGKAASGVMVLLAPQNPKNNEILFRRDQSDSDGTFTLPNIVPGHYRLLAIEKGWELEWANPSVLQAFLSKSAPVEIRANDHLKQTVEVQPR